ncbi:hypothetical protein [Patiriisocius sp. Uisw_017]|jgi:hypothetical protein|uniref:hypothetical protein n=1 Tax=Patiriisocius sp. Uisw_017 TaxID=3230968 RepID=UPI0039EA4D3A
MKRSTPFLLGLFIILCFTFGLHLLVLSLLELPLFENRIIPSYLINYLLAVLLFVLIQSNINKQSNNTAYIFMLGSGIKFVVFFTVFYPFYQEDGTMEKTEFAAFFVPYATCLIVEVLFLSKQLNNQTYSE